MILFLLVGLVFVATAVTLFVRALTVPRVRTMESLAQIPAYGYTGGVEPSRGTARNALDELASGLGATLGRYVSSMREEALRKQLLAAGLYSVPPRRFVGYQLLAAISLPIILAWLTILWGSGGRTIFLAVLFGIFAGWIGPRYVVTRRARTRYEKIEYDLPELIDLIVVSVESGLGLVGSLRIASERLQGPLGDEMKLMLHEQQMGLASDEALRSLLERCETDGVRSFVRAILQGEQLGVSIGQIMRSLAVEMRKKRRQKAEERAQKAPVKVLFPLVFLIFPSLFIVILGPAMFSLLDLFSEK